VADSTGWPEESDMTRVIRAVAVGMLAVFSVGTLHAQSAQKSLYDRLGGKSAIVAVVNDFVGTVAADKRINGFFAATAADQARLARFKENLVNQICEAAGGPCKYTGKDMKTAHQGMGISSADFNALVEDLTKTLVKFKVGKTEQDQLLGALAPMKPMIVEKN
jgi:hemoglobin